MSAPRKARRNRGKKKAAPTTTAAELQELYAALKAGHARAVEEEVAQRLQRRRDEVELLRVLAVARLLQQRMADAIRPLEQATRLDPSHAETWSRLGFARDATGDLEGAAAAHRRALELAPQQLPFRLNAIANAEQRERPDEGRALCHDGLEHAPEHPDLLTALARLLRAEHRPFKAAQVLTRAHQQQPDHPVIAGDLASVQEELGEPLAAIATLESLIERGAIDDPRLQQLTRLYLHERRPRDAERMLARIATPRWQQDAGYSHAHGRVLEQLGQIDAARQAYADACARDPERVSALRSWLLITPVTPDSATARRLQHLYDSTAAAVNPNGRARVGHLLAKIHWDAGDHAAAMAYYHEANGLLASYFARRPHRLESGPCTLHGAQLLRSGAATSSTPPAHVSDNDRPVFILGMPRSGKTVIESLLGQHPAVARTDEDKSMLVLLRRLVDDWRPSGPPPGALAAALQSADGDRLAALQARYLDDLCRFDPEARRFTQTLPFYLPLVGIIHQLFPRARFIFCRRDPADLGLACYGKDFQSEALMYTCDRYRLGQEIRAVERLIAHWEQLLPSGTACTVAYEDMVAHPDDVAERLWQHLDLETPPGGRDDAAPDTAVTAAGSFALTGSEPGAPHPGFVGIAEAVRDHLEPLRQGYADGPDW